MKNLARLAAASALAASSIACLEFEHRSSLAATATGTGALSGSWASTNLIPSPTTCADFKWNVTEQTATTASGNFSAACGGELKLSGKAQGELNGSLIRWSATGNATAPGLTSCQITLEGTAELTTDSMRVPYSGDTCLGKVNGVENMRRR